MYQKTILVYVHPKFLLPSDRIKHNSWLAIEKLRQNKEQKMDFIEAVAESKKGKSLTRPSWEPGMKMWWNNEVLLHSHPFNETQSKDDTMGGYIYVCEKDDALAKDWLVAC